MRNANDLQSLSAGRAIYNELSIVCILLLGILIALRSRPLLQKGSRRLTPIHAFTLLLFVSAILLVFIENLFNSGIGFPTTASCLTASVLDMVFYFVGKLAIHLFLLERVRLVRSASHPSRLRDWTWTVPIAVLGAGFMSLAVVAFYFLYHRLEPSSGSCSLGFPPVVTVLLLVYDAVISVALTSLFIYLLWSAGRRLVISAPPSPRRASPTSFESRVVKYKFWRVQTAAVLSDEELALDNVPSQPSPGSGHRVPTGVADVTTTAARSEVMQRLMRRTLIGAVLIFAGMLVNMATLVAYHGLERDWLCFTICTLDTVWCACVAFWLTERGSEEQRSQQGSAGSGRS
ncbi:hypothetical protein MRB53_040711 [Persea americana]|nr:hypothetical protein MRB53_040711 [Persea americana]